MISFILALAMILGILTHNFMKIDKLNRANPGQFNLKTYMQLEWASMCISACVMCAALIGQALDKDLNLAGWKLALGSYCIGLASQSVAYFLKNRTETEIKKAAE